jgi:hypothetical protein
MLFGFGYMFIRTMDDGGTAKAQRTQSLLDIRHNDAPLFDI